MKKFLIYFFLSLLVFTVQSFSQNLTELVTGKISGRVVSQITQNPIPGVTIKVVGTNIGAISKKDGSFLIDKVPVGIRQITFTSLAYEKFVATDVAVGSGKPTQLDVQLAEKTIRLDTIETRASYFPTRIVSVTSTQSLNFEDIRRAPGVQEDVLRATQLLPGVGVSSAGRNDLAVRGGAPYENLFVVDGIEVNNINHFGSQGSTGGPLSIINLDLVRNVDFSSGGFPAKYGDRTSSITNITLRNGNENALGGKINLSATGFGACFEGPIANSGSWLFSARRSYLDLIFKAAGFSFIPEYWDFQGKGNYRLDQNNTLSLIFISSIDNVTLNNDDLDNRYDNSRIAAPSEYQNITGATWKHLFGSGFSTVTLGMAYTKYDTYQNDSNLVEIFRNKSREVEYTLRTDFDFQIGESGELSFGNQIKYAGNLDYNILIPGNLREDQFSVQHPLQVDTNFNALKYAAYISYSQTIGNQRLTLGARMDYYSFTGNNIYISPRISYNYTLNKNSSLILSIGRYFQSPSYIWITGDSINGNLNAIQADQAVIGYLYTPLEDLKIQAETYYKQYNDYPARVWRPQSVLAPSGFDNVTDDIPFGLEPLESSGKGWSRGIEIFLQKKLSDELPFYGLMSFTYSESDFESLDGIERPGKYDSRIIFNIAAGYRIGTDWEISSKFRYATGVPSTPFLADGRLDFSKYNNGERLPVFHALDARVDKRWNFEDFTLITYIDIQNLYGRKNISSIAWDQRTGQPEYRQSIGTLPSIGASFEF